MRSSRPLAHSILILLFSLLPVTVCLAKDKPKLQGSVCLKGKSQSEYSSLAILSIQDAISIATKLTSGKVTEVALENEDGYLVYEVEIVAPDLSHREIVIDAGNGSILQAKKNNALSDDQNSEKVRDEN